MSPDVVNGDLVWYTLADLVVMDTTLLLAEPAYIRDARVLATVVGGRVVYEWR